MGHKKPVDPFVLPPIIIDGINVQQCTPWVVDPWMLDLQKRLFESDAVIPGIKIFSLKEIKHLPASEFYSLSDEERKEFKKGLQKIYSHNFSIASRRATWYRIMETAEENIGRTLFFPYGVDFRGRLYSNIAEWNPQGSDVSISLLVRKIGEKLTDEGMYWLKVGVATEWGHDKWDFDARAKWVDGAIGTISEWVDNPMGCIDQWINADKPLRFIGLARELVSAIKNKNYEVRRLVSLDGTCNGYQHMFSMVLDEEGGKMVNLTPGSRQDLYQKVADTFNDIAVRECLPYRADRSLVKRGVMTTPYGVTAYGIRTQLKGLVDEENRKEIGDLLKRAIAECGEKAYDLMKWFQAAAKTIIQENETISWPTPNDFIVTQDYRILFKKVIDIAVAKRTHFYLKVRDTSKTVHINKHINSISPNIIHSFDAAHLQRAITHPSIDRRDPTTWPTCIHDSFSVLPNSIPNLANVLRETFVDIYSINHLDRLYDYWCSTYGCNIPSPPQRGSLDIRGVLESAFTFS